jgi:hypothetical protein
MMKTLLGFMLQSAEVFQEIIPERAGRTMLQEFRNKLQAFYLFEYVDSMLGLSSSPSVTLQQMVDKASALGPFFSVWATEGLGHYYTWQHIRNGGMPDGLLSSEGAPDLPRHSLIPLHAGMGLALAESLLDQDNDPKSVADKFLRACHTNARAEYFGCAIEALGLVVRNLHPKLIASLDQEFTQKDQELAACFWHGVGRGIYFTPTNFVPCWNSQWQRYTMCRQEAPHELARHNAIAGYAWALTLVNLRQPEIATAFLKQQQGLPPDDALANGIFSALVIWLESTPQDSSVATFCNYDPGWLDSSMTNLWDFYVRRPGARALDFHRNPAGNHIGDLFRYQPLSY